MNSDEKAEAQERTDRDIHWATSLSFEELRTL